MTALPVRSLGAPAGAKHIPVSPLEPADDEDGPREGSAPPSARVRLASPLHPSVHGSSLSLAPSAMTVIASVAVLAVGLTALLLLHTWAAQDSFKGAALKEKSATLTTALQQLGEHDRRAASPRALRAAALALGMAPATTTHVVKWHDGRLVAKFGAATATAPIPPATAVKQPAHAVKQPAHATVQPVHATVQPAHVVKQPTHATVQPTHPAKQTAHAVQPAHAATPPASGSPGPSKPHHVPVPPAAGHDAPAGHPHR